MKNDIKSTVPCAGFPVGPTFVIVVLECQVVLFECLTFSLGSVIAPKVGQCVDIVLKIFSTAVEILLDVLIAMQTEENLATRHCSIFSVHHYVHFFVVNTDQIYLTQRRICIQTEIPWLLKMKIQKRKICCGLASWV